MLRRSAPGNQALDLGRHGIEQHDRAGFAQGNQHVAGCRARDVAGDLGSDEIDRIEMDRVAVVSKTVDQARIAVADQHLRHHERALDGSVGTVDAHAFVQDDIRTFDLNRIADNVAHWPAELDGGVDALIGTDAKPVMGVVDMLPKDLAGWIDAGDADRVRKGVSAMEGRDQTAVAEHPESDRIEVGEA